MILICPNCNEEHINDGLTHCTRCSDALVAPELKCANCGEGLLRQFSACGACGTLIPGRKLNARKAPPIQKSVNPDDGTITITIPPGGSLGAGNDVQCFITARATKPADGTMTLTLLQRVRH